MLALLVVGLLHRVDQGAALGEDRCHRMCVLHCSHLAWLVLLTYLVVPPPEVHTQLVDHVVRDVVQRGVARCLTVPGLLSNSRAILLLSFNILNNNAETAVVPGIVEFHLEGVITLSGSLAVDT